MAARNIERMNAEARKNAAGKYAYIGRDSGGALNYEVDVIHSRVTLNQSAREQDAWCYLSSGGIVYSRGGEGEREKDDWKRPDSQPVT